jgi:hypothetical protein
VEVKEVDLLEVEIVVTRGWKVQRDSRTERLVIE